MVHLNRLFWSFVMLLHTGFVGEVNSTGDIPCNEMSVDLQPDLYGMGKSMICMPSAIIVYFLCWYKYVFPAGSLDITKITKNDLILNWTPENRL